jgi:RNA methyltransferase, TrmH family
MSRTETITSAANPVIKDVRRAIARGGLTDQGWCVAESFHLLEEARRSTCTVKMVLASNAIADDLASRGIHATLLPDALFQSIAGTQNTQGVIALVEPRAWTAADVFGGRSGWDARLIVVLDELQDPGNAGTIARAAEAFGATGMLWIQGTASPFHPKVLRASAGSLFRVPLLHGVKAEEAQTLLRNERVSLFAAVPAGANARPLSGVDLTRACGIIIGNEARGVGAQWRAAEISIPTTGVESLNAAMAASILLYEARRQRMLRS